MKQTAVDYIRQEFHEKLTNENYKNSFDEIIKQAKKIFEKQIIDAWEKGNHTEMRGGNFLRPAAEQYYNETFKSE